MKLHLPKQLFTALLAAITLAAPAAWGDDIFYVSDSTDRTEYKFSAPANDTTNRVLFDNADSDGSITNTTNITLNDNTEVWVGPGVKTDTATSASQSDTHTVITLSGIIAGSGTLKFNEYASSATGNAIYRLTNANSTFTGIMTLDRGADNTADVQLSMAGVGEAFEGVEIQFKQGGDRILSIEGNTTLAGLSTSDSPTARVTSNSVGNVLTLNVVEGKTYTYAGAIGSGTYYNSTDSKDTAQKSSTSLQLVKTGAGSQTINGTVNLSSLTVSGGTLTFSGSNTTLSGTVTNNATLNLAGFTVAANTTASISGTGTTTLRGTVTNNGTLNLADFTVATNTTASISGTGTTTLSGTVTNNGTLNLAGFTVAADTTVSISGTGTTNLGGTADVYGTLATARQGTIGTMTVKAGGVFDTTAWSDKNTFKTLNDLASLTTESTNDAVGYIKLQVLATKNDDREVSISSGNISLDKNFWFVSNAPAVHGGSKVGGRTLEIGSNKYLKADAGIEAWSDATIAVSGGHLEAKHIILGHYSVGGDHYGALTMSSGSITTGAIKFNKQTGNAVTITGGSLEFTTSNALEYTSADSNVPDTSASVSISGATLKATQTDWTLDGSTLASAPTIGNVTIDSANTHGITLQNVSLNGVITNDATLNLAGFTVAADTTASISGTGTTNLSGTVTNNGTLNLAGFTVAAGAEAILGGSGTTNLSGTVTNSGTLTIAGTLSGTATLTNTDNGKVTVDTTDFLAFDGLNYTKAGGSSNTAVKAGFLDTTQTLQVLGEGVIYGGQVYINDSETGTTLTNGAITTTIGAVAGTFYVNEAWIYNSTDSKGAEAFHVGSAGTLKLTQRLGSLDHTAVTGDGRLEIGYAAGELGAFSEMFTGTLAVVSDGSLQMSSKDINGIDNTVVVDGGSLTLTRSGTNGEHDLTRSFDVKNGGTLTLSTTDIMAERATNTITVTNSTLAVGECRIASGAGTKYIFNNATVTGPGDSNGALDFNGNATLTSSGASSIEGALRVREGITLTLDVSGTLSVGTIVGVSDSSSLTKTGTGTLKITSMTQKEEAFIRGTMAVQAGAVEFNLNDRSESATGVYNTFSGTISGAGKLIKTGTDELVLSGANTYSGGTSIEAGTVTTQNASALGSGGVEMTGGELVVSDVANTNTDLTVGGAIVMNADATAKLATTGTTLSLGTTGSVKKTNADGTQHVTIASNGTNAARLTARSANAQLAQLAEDASFTIEDMTLTNTTISAATPTTQVKLQNVEGSKALLAMGAFTLNATPTVGEALTAESHGTLSYSNGLAIAMDKNASLTLNLDVVNAVAGDAHGTYDLTITLSGFGADFAMPEKIREMVSFDSTSWLGQALVSQKAKYTVVTEQTPATAGESGVPTVSYAAGTGANVGSLVITIAGLNVPEPATSTLSLLALAALAARRRRK